MDRTYLQLLCRACQLESLLCVTRTMSLPSHLFLISLVHIGGFISCTTFSICRLLNEDFINVLVIPSDIVGLLASIGFATAVRLEEF